MAMMLVLSLGYGSAGAIAPHPVPKDRAALANHDWLPHVLSKAAPLEWWSFAESSADIRREDYSSAFRYEVAKQDSWEFPRFCYSFFRPKPETMKSLIAAVNEYEGDVFWVMHDNCIGAMPGKPTFYTAMPKPEESSKIEELARNPPQANPEFVKRAMLDAPKFSAFLEQRLGLRDKPSLDFDPRWLTREGLAASREEFEDFWEPGDRSVFLARNPEEYAITSKPTSSVDRNLALSITMFEEDALLSELDAESSQRSGISNSLVPWYPLLSRLRDIADDAIYGPGEVDALLAEILRAQDIVKDPQSVRGLDNLARIARWAQKLKVGIYLGGQ